MTNSDSFKNKQPPACMKYEILFHNGNAKKFVCVRPGRTCANSSFCWTNLGNVRRHIFHVRGGSGCRAGKLLLWVRNSNIISEPLASPGSPRTRKMGAISYDKIGVAHVHGGFFFSGRELRNRPSRWPRSLRAHRATTASAGSRGHAGPAALICQVRKVVRKALRIGLRRRRSAGSRIGGPAALVSRWLRLDQVWRRNTTTLRISSEVMFILNF